MAVKTDSMDLLSRIRTDFLGLDTVYHLADGRKTQRVYLDSTASTLMMGAAHDALEAFYSHYSNTHSLLHFSAKISTREYQEAHRRILAFLGADPQEYACFFTGSGATAGINRLARIFRDHRPDKDLVLVSLMEHHSNDLPHRKHAREVIHLPLDSRHGDQPGCLNLEALEHELEQHPDRVNYLAVTGVSNVTGIINPIHDIAELVHRHGALILVDGAQMVAHLPIQLGGHANPARNIDAFVFSGHKTYAPGSPGVVLCRRDILEAIEPEEVGGGMIEQVFIDRYIIKDSFPDREEAGTPNIPGAISLATVIEVLDRIGMDTIQVEEAELMNYALEGLQTVPGLVIYGETDGPRAGSVSFNLQGLDHGLVAAILNDYFNIAVRNECFCAHPYVKEMILDDLLDATHQWAEEEFETAYKLKAGMVRASFGLYNHRGDVDSLVEVLQTISKHSHRYTPHYRVNSSGDYVHHSFHLDTGRYFRVDDFVERYL